MEPGRQEIKALEYLVSTSCGFIVNLSGDRATGFRFRPVSSDEALVGNDYRRGQRFWSGYHKRFYSSPLEAAVMFVNAVRTWSAEQGRSASHDDVAFH